MTDQTSETRCPARDLRGLRCLLEANHPGKHTASAYATRWMDETCRASDGSVQKRGPGLRPFLAGLIPVGYCLVISVLSGSPLDPSEPVLLVVSELSANRTGLGGYGAVVVALAAGAVAGGVGAALTVPGVGQGWLRLIVGVMAGSAIWAVCVVVAEGSALTTQYDIRGQATLGLDRVPADFLHATILFGVPATMAYGFTRRLITRGTPGSD